ncbi:MAG: aminopeptidase N [Bosea sp. (in: a-proteobacteria)]
MRGDMTPVIRLEDYRPPAYLIDSVDLEIRLFPSRTQVRSLLKVRPNPAASQHEDLVLDGEELSLKSVTCDGVVLAPEAYLVTPTGLRLIETPGQPFTLAIETEIDPGSNSKLMGLYRSNGIYCTQCEADGFRRITYFLDRPDVMSVYTVLIEADQEEAPILLANGNRMGAGPVSGQKGRHFALWHDPHPKPAYLFAVVGGSLEALTQDYVTADGRSVELAIWVEPGKVPRAAYAMDALVRCMRWDEQVFGLNYDLDVFNVVAVSHFNMGAMENKGLNIFNDKYVLADPETATDQDYAAIEAIIAHEYFHNWTGNRITCRDWFQLCLKEGLTVFRDQEFSSDMRSRPVKRIADVRTLRAAQFSEDSGPLAHAVRPRAYKEINNFYTPTVYEKGAELIRMLKLIIGSAAFDAGMQLYFKRCDGTAATIEEFIACFSESSGRDLTHFAQWYEQAGTPQLVASGRYDAMAQTYTLDLAQSTPPTPGQPAKQPMVLPIAFGLVGKNGALRADAEGLTRDGLILLDKPSASITFTGLTEKPTPSLLRGFSAPVRLELDLSDEELLGLGVRDGDPFNRWQSFQTVALRSLKRNVEAICAGEQPGATTALIEAFRVFLREQAMVDTAFAAQVLALPSEGDIAREIGRDVDPDAILLARRGLRQSIGRSLSAELHALNGRLVADSSLPYSPDAALAGRRALRQETLGFIMAGDAEQGTALALSVFEAANNLTERLGALAALCQANTPEREAALASFGSHYAQEPLVLDKWFTLQAAIPENSTVERVRRLMTHSGFDIGNPNRARALIGGFASGNPSQFNRADGAGYAFLSEMALILDKKNPQVAARLLGSFKTWRMLEPVRRAAAERALRHIEVQPGLSRDAADIVERALA